MIFFGPWLSRINPTIGLTINPNNLPATYIPESNPELHPKLVVIAPKNTPKLTTPKPYERLPSRKAANATYQP